MAPKASTSTYTKPKLPPRFAHVNLGPDSDEEEEQEEANDERSSDLEKAKNNKNDDDGLGDGIRTSRRSKINIESQPESDNEEMNVDNNEDDEDEDDEDPIIKKLPVFYTSQFLNSLTLLQFPDRPPIPSTSHPLLPPTLRPNNNSTDGGIGLEARYKPFSQHLEISIPIEKHEERFNHDQARHFASGVITEQDRLKEKLQNAKGGGRKNAKVDEEQERRDREERERRRLDRIAYKSITVPDVTNYLVGIVKDDQLHLSPVTQTFQLRPSLTYLDQIITNERRRKREEKASLDADGDSDGDISDTELKKEEAKAVQVSVKQENQSGSGGVGGGGGAGSGGGGSRGPANGRAGASLFTPLRQEEAEDWVKMKHYHADTKKAEKAFERLLVSPEAENVKLTSTTKPKQYLME